MQHLVTYGIDKDTGELRYIKDVQRGLACNCVCPKCGSALEAHIGRKIRPHFHHYSVAECKGAFESQLHLLSKAIIEERKTLMLPFYSGRYFFQSQQQQSFSEVILECVQNDLKPDCLCKYIDEYGIEQTLWVEILYSHAVDEEKARKIQERHIPCVEIDVSQLFKDAEMINKEILTDFLLNSPYNRHWIYYPHNDEQVLAEANDLRQKESIIEFLIRNSDDETRVKKFQSITYCLFSTGYVLSQNNFNSLYKFVKDHQSDYESFPPYLHRRYVSAIQMLLCQRIIKGKINNRNFSNKELLSDICFHRDNVKKQLSSMVNEIVIWGIDFFQLPRKTNTKRKESRWYVDSRGKWKYRPRL